MALLSRLLRPGPGTAPFLLSPPDPGMAFVNILPWSKMDVVSKAGIERRSG